MKKTPKDWINYQRNKGLAYITNAWLFDTTIKENKIPLKTKIALKEFEKIYCR